jgi:OTU domain-containing protein 3
LGLPKPRAALLAVRVGKGSAGASAGKIIIPGGRFQRPVVKGVDDEGEGEGEGVDEWKTNGAGRVDVRGFRELKI